MVSLSKAVSDWGRCLAQWVEQVSHVQRLAVASCSGPGFESHVLLRVIPPLSQPVSCNVLSYPVNESQRPKKKKSSQSLLGFGFVTL